MRQTHVHSCDDTEEMQCKKLETNTHFTQKLPWKYVCPQTHKKTKKNI